MLRPSDISGENIFQFFSPRYSAALPELLFDICIVVQKYGRSASLAGTCSERAPRIFDIRIFTNGTMTDVQKHLS
jgi:hypothetical protein